MPVKTLLIDNDPQLRQILGDRLEACGYHVIFAANGPEGIAKVEREQPEIVLLDLEMPEMNGLTVLAEIRRRDDALPVIMLTAYSTAAKAREARQCGAHGSLSKSSTLSQLLRVIQEVLRARLDNLS